MTGVTLERVVKRYGETEVIHGVDLEVADGEFCVFVGPSGCGRSTLMRMIAGRTNPSGHRRSASYLAHASSSGKRSLKA